MRRVGRKVQIPEVGNYPTKQNIDAFAMKPDLQSAVPSEEFNLPKSCIKEKLRCAQDKINGNLVSWLLPGETVPAEYSPEAEACGAGPGNWESRIDIREAELSIGRLERERMSIKGQSHSIHLTCATMMAESIQTSKSPNFAFLCPKHIHLTFTMFKFTERVEQRAKEGEFISQQEVSDLSREESNLFGGPIEGGAAGKYPPQVQPSSFMQFGPLNSETWAHFTLLSVIDRPVLMPEGLQKEALSASRRKRLPR
ncbi:hypothetical protein SODALDRAFT_360864 [Sodiomyces alkalinus F11]|uniref:Uncharacterized protein n=1 Tax=Sodiomyces alkalinus (strain CBS 110278 / VKM F-3762 / F11) TaxID=1314773 RepID=A0A3N2PRR6_SODAK|nr:hypothetical protein SODALDRAFT_360864 [Sodiomyces alkalinus F11]ROT37178.1 hypothetical protein SODALDRAFT_360864 [Sodiomyces alkalinus F11]